MYVKFYKDTRNRDCEAEDGFWILGRILYAKEVQELKGIHAKVLRLVVLYNHLVVSEVQ